MLDSERFDLAIIDINMPKISGLEVVKVCRFRSDLRDFPIIVLSADATPEMQKRCKDAGANEFLTKPFDAKELLDVIAGLSDQLSAADSSHFQLPVGIETSAAVELVNYSVLQQLTSAGIDADFMEELLGKFISQGERLLGAIKSAEFGIELSGFKDEMHSIKGAAAYLGAARLVKMCEKAEQIGSNRVLKSQKGIVDDFEQVFKSTQLELASYIRENKT
jgi:two-component system sensor histidine kinase RpfC